MQLSSLCWSLRSQSPLGFRVLRSNMFQPKVLQIDWESWAKDSGKALKPLQDLMRRPQPPKRTAERQTEIHVLLFLSFLAGGPFTTVLCNTLTYIDIYWLSFQHISNGCLEESPSRLIRWAMRMNITNFFLGDSCQLWALPLQAQYIYIYIIRKSTRGQWIVMESVFFKTFGWSSRAEASPAKSTGCHSASVLYSYHDNTYNLVLGCLRVNSLIAIPGKPWWPHTFDHVLATISVPALIKWSLMCASFHDLEGFHSIEEAWQLKATLGRGLQHKVLKPNQAWPKPFIRGRHGREIPKT